MSESTPQHGRHENASSSTRDVSSNRGRIIIVAAEDEASHIMRMIEDATGRPTTVVSNFFEAIGEIATTDMHSAPDAVIASVDAFGPRASEFVEALHYADPSVAVLAVRPLNEPLDDSEEAADGDDDLNAAVDAVLTTPISKLELERAIQSAGVMSAHPRFARAKYPPPRTTDSPDVSESDDHAPHETSESPTAMAERLILDRLNGQTDRAEEHSASAAACGADSVDKAQPFDSEDRCSGASMQPQPAKARPSFPTDESETIADTELIDRILRAPGSLLSTLELAIIARSGEADVRIAGEIETENPDDAEPIIYGEQMLGYLIAESMAPDEREKWALWASRYLALAERINAWRQMAYTDDLTGAWNRRFFNATVERTLKEAREQRRCVTILLFDIDDFKRFNDEHGHAAGDDILIEVVQLLKSVIRPSDKVCRIGGDEFIVIFYDPEGDRKPGSEHPRDIADIVERFQKQIATHHFPKLGRDAPGRLTISGGLATFPWDGQDVNSLLEHADQATLRAKRAGKDSIIVGLE